MSTTPLDTNFKDDILASSNAKRKYQMTYNDDGTVSFQDATAYSQMGSAFGAKEVNEERAAINKINSDRIVTLDEIDLVTEPGFFVDAMAVKELNRKLSEFYTQNGKKITFTPKYDCDALVSYEADGWGYDGGLWQLEVTATSITKPTKTAGKRAVFHGHNNTYSYAKGWSYFIGLKAGTSYTFECTNYSGSGGGDANPIMTIQTFAKS